MFLGYLKEDTAVTVTLPQAVDATDGFTPETSLTLTVYLSKNGGTYAARNSAGSITHGRQGSYLVPLDATDTNTPGILFVEADDGGTPTHRPIQGAFHVLHANVYDSLFGAAAADLLDVNIEEIDGGAVPAPAVTGVPDVNITHIGDGAVPAPGVTGVPDVNITHIGDGAVPAPAVTGVPDVNVTHLVDGAVPTPAATGVPDVNVTHYGDGAVPAPATTGVPDVNAVEINDNATAAANLALLHAGMEAGTAQTGGASTIRLRSGASAVNDFYNGAIIFLTGATGAGQFGVIADYDGTTKDATVEVAWATQPDATTTYIVMGGATPAAAAQTIQLDDANSVETGLTVRGYLRLMASAILSEVTKSGSTVTFRDFGDTKNRIVATVDSQGQRTAFATRDQT